MFLFLKRMKSIPTANFTNSDIPTAPATRLARVNDKRFQWLSRLIKTARTGLKAGVAAIGLIVLSSVAHAQIIECSFNRVTSVGMGSKANTRDFLGEAITFDTSKNTVRVQRQEGFVDLGKAQQVLRNNSFTSYNYTVNVNFRDGAAPVKLIYRLSQDKTGAEVRSEIQKNPGGGRAWKPNAARYDCK